MFVKYRFMIPVFSVLEEVRTLTLDLDTQALKTVDYLRTGFGIDATVILFLTN